MDIAAASMIMAQSKQQESANILLLKKAMNINKENNQILVQMISDTPEVVSVDPNLGTNLDVTV